MKPITTIVIFSALFLGCHAEPSVITHEDPIFISNIDRLTLDNIPGIGFVDYDGNVVITDADIEKYDWESHTITLRKGLREQLRSKYEGNQQLLSGKPFTVVVNKTPCFGGNFMTSKSSFSRDGICIVLDPIDLQPNEVQLEFGYPGGPHYYGPDLRHSNRLYKHLLLLGKLKRRT